MRRLATVLAACALVVLGSGTALASHSWSNYHWERSSNPLQLDIGSNVSSAWDGHLSSAVGDWEQSTVLDLTTVDGAGLKNCGPVAGRVEVCNDRYGYRNGGWLGIAQVWISGGHIVQSVVKVNDTFLFGGGTYDTPAWRQMVMCQEVGHAFGLDHQDEDFDNANLGTCMDYTDDPASNQHPNSHDYDQLETIYAHLDGGSGAGGNCPPKKPSCNGAAGSAPSFSNADRANGSLYVDRLGRGVTRVTHVLWAADQR